MSAGEPRKEDRRVRRNRDAICKAAVLCFERDGADRVTFDDIAEQADVARSTVFNHFPTQAAILEELFFRIIEEIVEETERHDLSGFRCGLFRLFDAIGAVYARYPETVRAIAGRSLGSGELAEADSRVDARMTPFLKAFVTRGAAGGEIRADLEPYEVTGLLLGLISVTNHDWINRGQTDALAAMFKRRFDLVFEGLKPRD